MCSAHLDDAAAGVEPLPRVLPQQYSPPPARRTHVLRAGGRAAVQKPVQQRREEVRRRRRQVRRVNCEAGEQRRARRAAEGGKAIVEVGVCAALGGRVVAHLQVARLLVFLHFLPHPLLGRLEHKLRISAAGALHIRDSLA